MTNDIAVRLAAARALEAQARRAEMALLAGYERDRADEARRVVVRLEREQAAAARAWVAANCGGHGHA